MVRLSAVLVLLLCSVSLGCKSSQEAASETAPTSTKRRDTTATRETEKGPATRAQTEAQRPGTGEGEIGLGNVGHIGHSSNPSGHRAPPGPRVETRIRVGTPEVQGPLDSAVVRRVVRQYRNTIRQCYEQALQTHPELAGRMEVEFAISKEGSVLHPQLTQNLSDESMGRCAIEQLKAVPFPEASEVSNVTYAFDFSTRTHERPSTQARSAAP